MSTFDFDVVINRRNTFSTKYDHMKDNHPCLPDDGIPMWIADMDFACPQPVLNAMQDRMQHPIMGYCECHSAPYWNAIKHWFSNRYQYDIHDEDIQNAPGVIPALFLLIRILTKEGEGVIIQTPSYPPFVHCARKQSRVVVESPLIEKDGYYTMDFADLRKKAADPNNKVMILCSPHNPTGRVWTKEELETVLAICKEHDIYLISDEIHCDIVRSGQKHIPVATLDADAKVVVCTAPSKTFNLATNQLANIIIRDPWLRKAWKDASYFGHTNGFGIVATIAAYQKCDDWLEALLAYLDDNFVFAAKYIKEHLPLAHMRISEGTYLAWIDLQAYGYTDAELETKLDTYGIRVQAGAQFFDTRAGHTRVNLACPRSTLEGGLQRMCTALTSKDEQPA